MKIYKQVHRKPCKYWAKVKKMTNSSPHNLEAAPRPPGTTQVRLIQNEDRRRFLFGMKTVYSCLTHYGYVMLQEQYIGLRGRFPVVVVFVKNTAVGVRYRPVLVLAAGMIVAGVRYFPPTSGTRGFSNYRCRSWAVAGVLPNHGRQRPLSTYIHRHDNCCLYPMACFAVRGKEALL